MWCQNSIFKPKPSAISYSLHSYADWERGILSKTVRSTFLNLGSSSLNLGSSLLIFSMPIGITNYLKFKHGKLFRINKSTLVQVRCSNFLILLVFDGK